MNTNNELIAQLIGINNKLLGIEFLLLVIATGVAIFVISRMDKK